MITDKFKIENIPSVLYGNKSDKLFIAVHGYMSNKEDALLCVFAEEAAAAGYQTLSFDLPQHGERVNKDYDASVQNCVNDLRIIINYAKRQYGDISLFACSLGAYLSLLEYRCEALKQVFFLSPVVNMKRIIDNMMAAFNVSREELQRERIISVPAGPPLDWNYYSYVENHPVDAWSAPTSILYGSEDNLCEYDFVKEFAERFKCGLQIMNNGEHYFHTEEQMDYFRRWLRERLRA